MKVMRVSNMKVMVVSNMKVMIKKSHACIEMYG